MHKFVLLSLLIITVQSFSCPVPVHAEAEAEASDDRDANFPAGEVSQADTPVLSDEAPAEEAVVSTWDAEAELGMIITSGNTESESTNAKIKVQNDRVRWRHRLDAEYLMTADALATTAERYSGTVKSDLKVSERDFFYVILRYVDDVFAGYHYQFSESMGYGRRFLPLASMTLELEVGAGGRHTKYVEEMPEDDRIVRGGLKFSWKLDKQGELTEEAFTERGGISTHTESVTSLKARLNGMLAMKMSYTMKHDSHPKSEARPTDRILSVALVFDLL